MSVGPLPLPLRVLVKGSSIAVLSSELNGPRENFTFPRAIEAALYAAGHPAEVRNTAEVGQRAKVSLGHWEREVLAFSPDVVVLVYGYYEAIHIALPWWLERHANSWRVRPRRVREAYRKNILRTGWIAVAKSQVRLDRRFNLEPISSSPRRVKADVERLIFRVREIGSPLVLVLELLPPGPRGASWFPGMTGRIEAMNAALAEMVRRIDDPEVRMFSVSAVASRHLPPEADRVPDAIHYSAELHRLVGEGLAAEILAWARTQPHLPASSQVEPPPTS